MSYEYDETLTMEQATDYLRELYSEFPFHDWVVDGNGIRQSRGLAVQIAAMLSQFTILMLPKRANRMGFIYSANSQRSGKTLLAKMALIPVHGNVAMQTWKKEEELVKIIDAQMLEAKSYIVFDNCRGFLSSQTVEALMTSPQWTGRVLGLSKTFTVDNYMTVFITGNDCTLSSDMAYRCLTVNLFVNEAEVQDRSTRTIIDEPWLSKWENRHKMLSCLWAIVRSWNAAGRPKATDFGAKLPLGFEAWGQLVGGLVAHAGFGNCLAPSKIKQAGDNEKTDMTALVTEMATYSWEGADRQDWKFEAIVKVCYEEELFSWMLDGKEKNGTFELTMEAKTRFGHLLKRYAPDIETGGRVFKIGEQTYTMSCRGTGRHKRYCISRPSQMAA
jgi:hypothetical protein